MTANLMQTGYYIYQLQNPDFLHLFRKGTFVIRGKGEKKKFLDSNHSKHKQCCSFPKYPTLCLISIKFSKAYKLQHRIYLFSYFIYFGRYHDIYLTRKNYARRPSKPVAIQHCWDQQSTTTLEEQNY